ncbi:MAG: YeeE/YedE family protein [Sphingobacteriales bacterium]|nr:MAG: YeeE/YedE family protein [Sphingobacteriales bacterium]
MFELLKQPWPWYTSGTVISLIMITLLYFGKSFGFSSNLRTICAMAGAGRRVSFFNFDWKEQRWNLLFLVGAVIGGFISSTLLSNDAPLQLSSATVNDLQKLNIHFNGELNPAQLFSTNSLDLNNIVLLLTGGLLVGFGSRYAGGCTSGHAISGLSNLQLPSLIAVIGFFAGGLIMTWLIFPIIF